jgi:hypothetical protein
MDGEPRAIDRWANARARAATSIALAEITLRPSPMRLHTIAQSALADSGQRPEAILRLS